jgi:Tol biopolymer transport system component
MYRKCVVILVPFFIALSACHRNINEPTFSQPGLILSAFPDIGTQHTAFVFSVLALNEYGDSLEVNESYKFRWDWQNDGSFDTEWLDVSTATHRYSEPGKKVVKLQVKEKSGATYTLMDTIFVRKLLQITENTTGSIQGNIDWSRDGSNRIVFEWRPTTFEHQIYIVKYPGGTPQLVTFDIDSISSFYGQHFPEWSPDGKQIAFECQSRVVILDLETREYRPLIQQIRIPMAWSPDGKYILGRNDFLYCFETATGQETVIRENAMSFCWSPDGSMIAFTTGGETPSWNVNRLHFLDFSTKKIIKEIPIPGAGFKLDWSPKGKLISLGFIPGSNILMIIDYETGRLYHILTDGWEYPWYPSWSEDGTLLAFEATETGSGRKGEIWAIEVPEEIR